MKKKFLKGTLILTIAGLLSRLIGFVYKIYLAKGMTSENMGIYQLVFPVFSICFTIFASGIQTTISKYIAEYTNKPSKQKLLLLQAVFTSEILAVILMMVISNNSVLIAIKFIHEAKAAAGIKILSYSFPFCAITSCINGYFYGLKKSGIPASSQLVEQIVRVGVVYIISSLSGKNMTISCELAVLGIVVGEISSCLFNSIFMLKSRFEKDLTNISSKEMYKSFSMMYIPLTINRLVLCLLRSLETILMPTLLIQYGMSRTNALSTLGILNGMTIPFLVFPSAITSAISIIMLPTISEANSKKDHNACIRLTNKVLKYSLILGFYCFGIFSICGRNLCTIIFNNELSGKYLFTLSFLCPLMYMSASVPSIINGLGKPLITFRNSVIINTLQLALLFILIKNYGILGYFITMFIMQVIQAMLDIYTLNHENLLKLSAYDSVLLPGICLIPVIALLTFISGQFAFNTTLKGLCLILSLFCVIYTSLLLLSGTIKKKDFF